MSHFFYADPADENTSSDLSFFGIIHGDVNPSNFHWDAVRDCVCMFDWDQLQRCWFLYDVAQPIWGVVMLAGAGSPADRKPVPQADVELYTNWLLEGYEAAGSGKVDRAALQRMVDLRRELYSRFCRRAVLELDPDSFMGQFCRYIVQWLDSAASSTTPTASTQTSAANA